MRTDQLIESLVAELKPIDRTRINRALLSALAIGAIAVFSIMFAVFGAVPNLLGRPHPDVFVSKDNSKNERRNIFFMTPGLGDGHWSLVNSHYVNYQ